MKTVASLLAAVSVLAAAAQPSGGTEAQLVNTLLSIDPAAMLELWPLASEALQIQKRADERAAAHAAELAKRAQVVPRQGA